MEEGLNHSDFFHNRGLKLLYEGSTAVRVAVMLIYIATMCLFMYDDY